MPTVHAVGMIMRSYQHYTLCRQNILGIAQEKLKAVFLVHLFHGIRQYTDIAFCYQGRFYNIYPFRLWCSTGGSNHLLGNLYHNIVPTISFIQYHIRSLNLCVYHFFGKSKRDYISLIIS